MKRLSGSCERERERERAQEKRIKGQKKDRKCRDDMQTESRYRSKRALAVHWSSVSPAAVTSGRGAPTHCSTRQPGEFDFIFPSAVLLFSPPGRSFIHSSF